MSELQNVKEQIAELIVRVERVTRKQCQFGGAGVAAWIESVGKPAEAHQYRILVERRTALQTAAQGTPDE